MRRLTVTLVVGVLLMFGLFRTARSSPDAWTGTARAPIDTVSHGPLETADFGLG